MTGRQQLRHSIGRLHDRCCGRELSPLDLCVVHQRYSILSCCYTRPPPVRAVSLNCRRQRYDGPMSEALQHQEPKEKKRVMFTIPADSIQNIRSWARKRRTLSVSLLMRYRREPADDGPYTDDWNPLPVEFLRRFRHSGNKKRTGAGDSFKRNAGQKNLSTG